MTPVAPARGSGHVSRTSQFGTLLSEEILETASIQVQASSEGCSTPTVAGDSEVQDNDYEVQGEKQRGGGGKMGSFKRLGARKLLRSLDCRQGAATLFDDSSSDVVKVPPPKPSQDTEKFPTTSSAQNSQNPAYNASKTSDKRVCLTEEYHYSDGDIRTRTIIRSRKRSHHATKKANRHLLPRIRSLDCMRNDSAFENSVDAFQTRTFGSLLPDLSVDVVEESSKKEDLIHELPEADLANKRMSVISANVEVGRKR